jgi:hypothetical protein
VDYWLTHNDPYSLIYKAFLTKPSLTDALKQQKFVNDRITSGVWAKLDKFLFFGTPISGQSLVSWKTPGILDPILSIIPPTFWPYRGFEGVPVNNTYINTKYNAVRDGINYTLNDAGFGIFLSSDKIAESCTTLGACQSILDRYMLIDSKISFAGNKLEYALNSGGIDFGYDIINNDAYGFYHLNKSIAGQIEVNINGVKTIKAQASTAIPDQEVIALGRQIDGIIDRNSSDLITAIWFSSGLSDAEIADLRAGLLELLSGPWVSKGTILTGTEVSEDGNVCEPNVIYESGAQILSGTVFKMWYTGGWTAPNTPKLHYAESADGITWSKYSSNPILTDIRCTKVIKIGAVYYLYAAKLDLSAIDLYTSFDGLSFTLDTANILIKGTGIEWDSGGISNMDVIIESGTWYMYYEAFKAGTEYRIGYATSPDGVVWTKQTSPIINGSASVSGPNLHKIGANYYMWLHGNVADISLPTDLYYRYKSTDLITWIKDTASFVYRRTTADEGVSTLIGQVADIEMMEVNDKVYMFHAASANGSDPSGSLHIKLAIADMPFTSLILIPEGNSGVSLP